MSTLCYNIQVHLNIYEIKMLFYEIHNKLIINIFHVENAKNNHFFYS